MVYVIKRPSKKDSISLVRRQLGCDVDGVDMHVDECDAEKVLRSPTLVRLFYRF